MDLVNLRLSCHHLRGQNDDETMEAHSYVGRHDALMSTLFFTCQRVPYSGSIHPVLYFTKG